MIKKTIIKLNRGSYVKSWQYSQGEFSYSQTEDPLKACHIDKEHLEMFRPRVNPYTGKFDLIQDVDLLGCKLLEVEITFEVKKETVIVWDSLQ